MKINSKPETSVSLSQLEKHRWAESGALAALHMVLQYIYRWCTDVEKQ